MQALQIETEDELNEAASPPPSFVTSDYLAVEIRQLSWSNSVISWGSAEVDYWWWKLPLCRKTSLSWGIFHVCVVCIVHICVFVCTCVYAWGKEEKGRSQWVNEWEDSFSISLSCGCHSLKMVKVTLTLLQPPVMWKTLFFRNPVSLHCLLQERFLVSVTASGLHA